MYRSMTTYKIDSDAKTVLGIDENGEAWDLNSGGEPCRTITDLESFIRELHEQGTFPAETRDELLARTDVV